MADEFDEELDRGPEGHIITPILLGCGAMGLGCLFSVGAIAIVIMIFMPGIWALIGEVEDGLGVDVTLPMVEANEAVVAAVGLPMEAGEGNLDLEAVDGDNEVNIGDQIGYISTYPITGPNGSAEVTVEGTRQLVSDSEWTVDSVLVTLEDGTVIRVFPSDTDVPPPPTQLAPPDVPDTEEIPVDETPIDEVPADEPLPDEPPAE